MTADSCQCGEQPTDDDRLCKCGASVTGRQIMDAITTGIIDVYHGDADNMLRAAGIHWSTHDIGADAARQTVLMHVLTDALRAFKAAGGVMVIAKASQGKDYVDPAFFALVKAARAVGLDVGAYDFPSLTSPPEQQCDWFLSTCEQAGIDIHDPSVFLALDKETNPNAGGTLTADGARRWINHFRARTGRWPGYYTNTSQLHADLGGPDDVIRRCVLWVAAYGNFMPRGPHTAIPFVLWQYQGSESDANERPRDAALYPSTFAGVGKVDANVFYGTVDELRAAFARAAS